jgi:HEAT repeat protein
MKRKVIIAIMFLSLPVAVITVAVIRGNAPYETARAGELFSEMTTEEPSSGLEALRKMGPAALPTLEEALKSPLSPTRVRATWALGRLGPVATNAIADIIRGLDDDDLGVRVFSMESLNLIGTTRLDLVPQLLARFDKLIECNYAAELVDKIEQERKALNLSPVYSDQYEYAMAFARAASPVIRARALSKLPQGDERSIAAFRLLLNDADAATRQQTAIFLKSQNIVLPDETNVMEVSP